MNKTALICGISGQDGAYLARFLISKGYRVYGSSRDSQRSDFGNLKKLGVYSKVQLINMRPDDFKSVFLALNNSKPDEIYFLAGQTSVGLSFELPAETIQSISIGTLNLLEAIRIVKKRPRIYFAGSSECFGDTQGIPANEETPFNPKSPYAVAKSSAYWLVNNYREAYNLFACTGILFNHESPLRAKHFVTQKIILAVKAISNKEQFFLDLGSLNISRDWGWAPEYVEAMWQMLQLNEPEDFVISTGETNSIEKFVQCAFDYFNLDWREYVRFNNEFLRPSDILINVGDSSKAKKKLNWNPKYKMQDVVKLMIENTF